MTIAECDLGLFVLGIHLQSVFRLYDLADKSAIDDVSEPQIINVALVTSKPFDIGYSLMLPAFDSLTTTLRASVVSSGLLIRSC